MPLENAIAVFKRTQQRITPTGLRQADSLEPQLADRRWKNISAECASQHLRAEADPQDRRPSVDRLTHQLSLGQEIWMPIDLVDIHLAAKHDQSANFLQRRPLDARLECIHL